MPEHTPEGGAGTAPVDVEDRAFTQEDVDRIVTERLRRERQRTEKVVRDEYEQRIAELETNAEDGRQARGELRTSQRRTLIAERLLSKGSKLPPAYLAGIDGDDDTSVDAAIQAAESQWAADIRLYGRKPADIGAPSNPTGTKPAAGPKVDADLAERMRRGDAEAFREYRAARAK